MTKQKKIQEAYGEHWDKVKDFVDGSGWCNSFWGICEINKGYTKPKSFGTKWRPKSLQGIEINNGWIKIESESDLPKTTGENIEYNLIVTGNSPIMRGYFHNYRHWIIYRPNGNYKESKGFHEVTHYQPIIKPLPPIY